MALFLAFPDKAFLGFGWESGETRFLDVSPYSQLSISIPINSRIDATRKATEGIELNGEGGFPRPSMSARS